MNLRPHDVRLVLLCPAWKTWGTASTVKPSTVIPHSGADEVNPFEHMVELITNSRLPGADLIEVGRDHRLADLDSLRALLWAVESPG